MKKFIFVALSILAGLVTVLYFNEFVQGIIASAVLRTKVAFSFNGIILTAFIPFVGTYSFFTYFFLLLAPLLLSGIFIELSAVSLKKIINLNLRTGVIIFELVNVGYIVVNIFIGILSVLLKGSFENGWSRLFEFSGVTFERQLIVMFLLLLLSLTYINFSANRLKNYITIIKEK